MLIFFVRWVKILWRFTHVWWQCWCSCFIFQGVPIRIELGPRDVKQGNLVAVRRDTGDKTTLKLDDASKSITNLLEEIHNSMFSKYVFLHIQAIKWFWPFIFWSCLMRSSRTEKRTNGSKWTNSNDQINIYDEIKTLTALIFVGIVTILFLLVVLTGFFNLQRIFMSNPLTVMWW